MNKAIFQPERYNEVGDNLTEQYFNERIISLYLYADLISLMSKLTWIRNT